MCSYGDVCMNILVYSTLRYMKIKILKCPQFNQIMKTTSLEHTPNNQRVEPEGKI